MQSTEPAGDHFDDLPPEAEPDAFVDELKQGTKLLNGQYTIMSFLNSGGFGITYLAKDSLDRTVVIKECFPNSLCRRSETIVRARSRAHQGEFRSVVRLFVQEARSLSKLVHPNIVGVHQVFEDNDTAYMAIDYVNGKDLLEILDSTDQAFTPDEVVELLKKTLGAVEFIHQTGILHRDISPDNILIDAHKNPILIDFGAAREQITKASRVLSARRVVKDGYSPQEFYLAGSAQGPYSDLYALAATFYHVISGDTPPESQRRLAAIAEGAPDPYKALAGRIPGYPPGFLEAIDKAASVLPKDRIESAADWLELIRTGQTPVPTRAASALRTPTRILTNMISPSPATEATSPSRAPLLLGSTAMAALALGLGVWMIAGGEPDSALATGSVAPAGLIASPEPAEASIAAEEARLAAEAAATAKAEEDARLAAEATAEEEARLAAAAEAQAQAEEVARLAAEAEAAALAEEEARLAAEAEAAALAEEEARLAAESAAKAEEEARLAAEAAALAEEAAEEAAIGEARAAALAAIKPRPALADTPVLDDQFAEVRWDYGLPFRTEVQQIDGESFPVITRVVAKALSGTSDDAWIVPGTTIYAINGEWVTNGAAIEDLIRVSTTPDEYGLISATVRIRAVETGLFEQEVLVAPATRWISLKNGTVVRTDSVNGKWQSVVDTITFSDENGLMPGDMILRETTLGRQVDAAESFEVMIDLLAFKAEPEASFEVLRNGEVITVRMPLARQ